MIGVAIFLIVSSAIERVLLHRLPSFTGPPRPYAIPGIVAAVVAAAWILLVPKEAATPDMATYAVAVPIVIVGQFLSDLWWSFASSAPDAS